MFGIIENAIGEAVLQGERDLSSGEQKKKFAIRVGIKVYRDTLGSGNLGWIVDGIAENFIIPFMVDWVVGLFKKEGKLISGKSIEGNGILDLGE